MIDEFIVSEFEWAKEAVKSVKANRHDLMDEANTLFRDIIGGVDV